jgi:hypothetical protein
MIQRLRWAAYSSLGAGLIHGIAVGLHSEHAPAARAFLFLAVLQLGWGIAALCGAWYSRSGSWWMDLVNYHGHRFC